MHNFNKILLLFFVSIFCASGVLPVYAQKSNYVSGRTRQTVVGLVVDSVSGERLGFVNVAVKGRRKGVLTDKNGVFKIPAEPGNYISISSLGFNTRTIRVGSSEDTIRVFLSPNSQTLEDVYVKSKRAKYSKKNNPAVELMKKVRNGYNFRNPEKEDYYSYDRYDKILLGINEFSGDFSGEDAFSRQFKVFSDYVDTAAWTGKRILNLSLKEKNSKMLFRKTPSAKKEILLGYRSNGIDDAFEQDNIRPALEDVLREIEIYNNDIAFLQNRFVSPLSAIAPDFYKFEIVDTVVVGGERCVELSFVPHNYQSMGFNGKLYIPVGDSIKYVKRVMMRVPKDINLNYVDNIFVSQNFEKDSLGNIHKTVDDVCLEMEVLPGAPKIYGSRMSRYDNFSYKPVAEYAEMYESIARNISLENAEHRGNGYWDRIRKIELSGAERQMGSMMTRIRKVPLLYWTEKVLKVLVNGYITTGRHSKFDIGPVNTFLSFNKAEGTRLRVGGMTTANLFPNLFARGYVAYGFKDRKFKYRGELEYSFVRKKYHSREFPMNGIRASYEYDVDQLGQHYLFTNQDNLFLSLKRMGSELITYRRRAMLEYNLELRNNFSINVGYKREIQEATPWVTFKYSDGREVSKFTQGAFFINLRYAPGEKFVQGATSRKPINMDAPIFQLTQEFGPQRFLGADFTLNKTEISVSKRFWFSAFGYANCILKGGKIWSQVQFPALLWQNANLSYTIQPESFSLLNPMEFAMDEYAALDVTYFMNGLIFNRIPYVKSLKLREVLTFKGFLGHLSKKNNPDYNPGLFRFPYDSSTVAMGRKPYMELGVGIDNILTILRVDYVWRLTYRDRPGIDKGGIRISLHFSF